MGNDLASVTVDDGTLRRAETPVGAASTRSATGMSAPWITLLVSAAVSSAATYLAVRASLRRHRKHRQQSEEMARLHLATIEALALAIDAKDQTPDNHLQRVQTYAGGLAEALGMTPQEVQGVRTAAMLHDIGKLGVPEHILSKPGPLTQEEFQKVRVHPQVGAEILASVPFPYPVTALIRGHHERWDGRGYPSGLRGEDIPLGARILALVDYYDALISDRPYHKAMSEDAALNLLQQEAGKALDPKVVSTFVRTLPDLRAACAPLVTRDQSPSAGVQGRAEGSVDAVDRPKSVFEDIALAHREIYALYEIAQSMGTSLGVADTMSLISSKLANLVPFSTCALFLSEGDQLRCRFATGIDANSMLGLSVRSGAGLTGWVARNRRPLVNARSSADFEAGGSDGATSLQSALVCPLVYNDRLIGTLGVHHLDPSFYGDDHRRLLERVCEQAAAVIYNSVVFEQTREEALTDALTSLPNTRFMSIHVSRELSRAERLTSEVAMLVLDLDDFKEINDRYGHHVGDRALRTAACVLRSTIRPYDVCVRYAGDEFIVVLSGCGREEAEWKLQELQEAVNQATFDDGDGHQAPLSISGGVAVFPHDGTTYEALLAHADTKMYVDKGRRKQAVAAVSGLSASGQVHRHRAVRVVGS
jgi:diguanylate cyclase (GGDEF)-like protein/putative nucleotidyltransferase with HDIG domain